MSLSPSLSQYIVRRPQRLALLQHIAEQGSITRAAKSAGLSYKAAWDAIDELNNLSNHPLVERSVGGRGGGGAKLSPEGERVLRLYQRLQALQTQLLEAAEDGADLELLSRLTLRTSARNQLLGHIKDIQRQGLNDLVSLELAGGGLIDAQITHDSSQRLELRPGAEVMALIKAGWLDLLAADHAPAAGYNALHGEIDTVVEAHGGPSEVRIALPSGQVLCALAAPARLHALGLRAGSGVVAQFAPAQVLLGTVV
ncbi:TOBE domain-containing protein [Pseudomonas sp. DTU_2021_1001937_2_SI_NGA_ILE_001]|uniref:TOBE domain-containing protein n=1 Tax=Pseudomonas sp. DTU_2021_1001937_2_SI_NGA_ILE_001 TaxID=3077589 RepID=UPI0028FC23D2|nr:TOBE domain-containing protein [Pseudomonas sp. DTU_2021_1001937_2_SI_NGA_ILE_001]WNW12201.1 TOBE domain-containing protein [Pseudomonas sp. DTU_2021_1001937_2_SI_NGA_ILE_001]